MNQATVHSHCIQVKATTGTPRPTTLLVFLTITSNQPCILSIDVTDARGNGKHEMLFEQFPAHLSVECQEQLTPGDQVFVFATPDLESDPDFVCLQVTDDATRLVVHQMETGWHGISFQVEIHA